MEECGRTQLICIIFICTELYIIITLVAVERFGTRILNVLLRDNKVEVGHNAATVHALPPALWPYRQREHLHSHSAHHRSVKHSHRCASFASLFGILLCSNLAIALQHTSCQLLAPHSMLVLPADGFCFVVGVTEPIQHCAHDSLDHVADPSLEPIAQLLQLLLHCCCCRPAY